MHGYSSRRGLQSSSGRARAGSALAAVALLVACAPSGRAPPAAERIAPAAPLAAAGSRYRIDAARSDARILVYRAGPLARLGHNHVLVVRGLEGDVWLPADPAAARFSLSFPVAALAIDEPAARRAEGADFAVDPSAEDVAGTRRNLEGPAVLDAARYPRIGLEGVAGRDRDGFVAHGEVRIRDRTFALEVPVALTTAPGELVVHGGFSVTHAALGLVPFSAGLGALKVREDLAIRFRLVAVADPKPTVPGGKP